MTHTTPPDSDQLTRFLLPHAADAGMRVHLGEAWQRIRERGDYPPAAAELLGEAAAAAALFTGHAKIEGRLSVQLRGEGRLRTLFAECTAAGTLRGIVRLAEDDDSPVSRDLGELGEGAVLAITVENPGIRGRDPSRYQGLVPLQADSLAGAFEDYFRRSEQLPTRLLLAVDETSAAGLMLQKLPGDEGDEDGWNRASALFDTLTPAELLGLSAETLLHRLFHEDGPQRLLDRPLGFGCSCSRERVAAMLQSLGEDEAHAAVIGGVARIRCEFCGEQYAFEPDEVSALFAATPTGHPPPERVQ
jgi:molecular chaperone Hsp33